jgi:cell division protein FtsN
MSKTEGEYELVLGNRQLLSAFFIIVILFGVFFTMGYVVGRNSAPATAASPMPAPVAASPRPEALPPPSTQSPASAPQTAAAPVESTAPPPVEESKPKPVEMEAKREAPPPKVETRVEPPPPARPSARAASASGAVAVTPGPGNMYLQVAAAAQPQAGVVVDTLKQKGFPALLAQGPNATLFRVMVGPFADASSLGKAKAELENAGFRPLVRK